MKAYWCWLASCRRNLMPAASRMMMSEVLKVVRWDFVSVPHKMARSFRSHRKAIAPFSCMRESTPPHGEEEHQRSD